ncbi:hypothetical protein Salat_0140500 [Sesamum alatum]|uniref:DUF7026 domain-containing protein n=1 Tax=Sesamum alatum TaxID=300844 RepID=A0AAE2CXU5_9LAMI|nr:hypothetical protein Salat_0140500 [Sesamum alatum]
MGSRIQTLSPNLLPQRTKFEPYPFPSNFAPTHLAKPSSNPPRTLRISCSKEKEGLTDEMLAVELGIEIKKLNSHTVQRDEALKKSRELLFAEVCKFMGLKSDDLRKKWKRMNEEERWVLAKGFVTEWSAHFHPLSARSVKELVEEHLAKSNEFSDSVPSKLFPELRKFLGFPQNSEG